MNKEIKPDERLLVISADIGQAAEKQALLTIKNLINLEKNNTLEQYVVKKRPMVISLGSKNAIFTYKNITFYGFIPAIMKKLIEFKTLFRYRNL